MLVVVHVGLLGVQLVKLQGRPRQQEPHHEVHQLVVLLLAQPVIFEHETRAEHADAAGALLLPHRPHRPVHGVRDLAARQDAHRRLLHRQRGAVRKHEVQAVVVLQPADSAIILPPPPHHPILLPILFSTLTSLSHGVVDLAVQHAVGDEHFFGMQVLVVHRAHHAVRVYGDPELLQQIVDVRVVLRLPALPHQHQHRAASQHKLLHGVELVHRELLAWCAQHEDAGLAQRCARDLILVRHRPEVGGAQLQSPGELFVTLVGRVQLSLRAVEKYHACPVASLSPFPVLHGSSVQLVAVQLLFVFPPAVYLGRAVLRPPQHNCDREACR
mmetsp:Transcript_23525/g.39446  ORF Transcript_23525/g.39446 Transcript_23525/m.39446 type:complete len:328 (-) Transcript_23525:205-1188(-)